MLSRPSLTVLSLGGGVQSSVMALMAGERAFDRTPDCAILADSLWEPPIVYEHIDWLRDRLSFPLHVVDNGRSRREDVKAVINRSGSRSYVDIPVFLKGRDGEADGIGRRQCTTNYMVMPIRRKICTLLGLRKGQRVPSATTVELWLGISTDEAVRMKDSRNHWMANRYPLIGAGMSRRDCIDSWSSRYDRPLERSALDLIGGGRICSPRRWRPTRRCETDSPSLKNHTCIPCGRLLTRPSRLTRRSSEAKGKETDSVMSARGTLWSVKEPTERRRGVVTRRDW